jgi:hypothetical protein
VPDLLFIASAVASIVSLFLTLAERFTEWRKYLLPLSCALGGFALGRVSVTLPNAREIAGDPVLLIAIAVSGVIAAFAFLLLNRGEIVFAYMMVSISLVLILTKVISYYSETNNPASADDYLSLAEQKEHNGDLTGAVRLLESAKRLATSDELKNTIDEQIKAVAKRRVERLKQIGKESK